jgi:hypothetical protein
MQWVPAASTRLAAGRRGSATASPSNHWNARGVAKPRTCWPSPLSTSPDGAPAWAGPRVAGSDCRYRSSAASFAATCPSASSMVRSSTEGSSASGCGSRRVAGHPPAARSSVRRSGADLGTSPCSSPPPVRCGCSSPAWPSSSADIRSINRTGISRSWGCTLRTADGASRPGSHATSSTRRTRPASDATSRRPGRQRWPSTVAWASRYVSSSGRSQVHRRCGRCGTSPDHRRRRLTAAVAMWTLQPFGRGQGQRDCSGSRPSPISRRHRAISRTPWATSLAAAHPDAPCRRHVARPRWPASREVLTHGPHRGRRDRVEPLARPTRRLGAESSTVEKV